MSGFIENIFIEKFENTGPFSREDLFDFFKSFEPDLKEGTLGWRIYELKRKDIIKPIRRGLYKVSCKPKYKPKPSNELIKLSKLISERFSEVKHCVWETAWLNEFSQHQASKRMILIEIEADLLEPLYFELKDKFRYDFFLNPGQKTIDFYVAESRQPVILRKLISRSPTIKRKEKRTKFHSPKLEKILVDLFAEESLFYFLQGSELVSIYESALKNYALNFTTLFSYAKRRDREQEIKQFMANHMYDLVKDHIDD